MHFEGWIGLGTLLTAVVGLALVLGQLREQRRAMRADFGNVYIERYWQIDDDLLLEPKGTEAHQRHRHRYLRLYEDEFDAASLGFLERRQWQVWHATLDDPAALNQIGADLDACDPDQERFARIRACIQQRADEQSAHLTRRCRGTTRD